MSDEYDILVEISLDDVKKAAEERDNRDTEITRLREEIARLREQNTELMLRAHALLWLLPPETT